MTTGSEEYLRNDAMAGGEKLRFMTAVNFLVNRCRMTSVSKTSARTSDPKRHPTSIREV